MKAIVKQEPTSYSGIVTLTVLNKRGLAVEKKVIKNNGVNRLFALLCRFLNGSLTMGKPDSDAVQAIKSINEALPKFKSPTVMPEHDPHEVHADKLAGEISTV